jgi:hypothetical protein
MQIAIQLTNLVPMDFPIGYPLFHSGESHIIEIFRSWIFDEPNHTLWETSVSFLFSKHQCFQAHELLSN